MRFYVNSLYLFSTSPSSENIVDDLAYLRQMLVDLILVVLVVVWFVFSSLSLMNCLSFTSEMLGHSKVDLI